MTFSADGRHERAAEALNSHPDYRVLCRLMPVTAFHDADPRTPSRIGVAVDVDTTGLDRETVRIIELAVERFRFDALGHVIQVGVPRVWREDPVIEPDRRITTLTGHASDDIAGQV